MIILGVDPGTVILGYAIIQVEGKKLTCLHLDALKLNPKKDPFDRLADIHSAIAELFAIYRPDTLAVEAPFFGKNVQSMLKLGRAQGVIMSAGLAARIPVEEYSPRKVKQAITGNGAASKEQVSGMLQHIYGLKEMPKSLDATDGLAVATCHAYALDSPIRTVSPSKLKAAPKGKGKGSWAAFLTQHPDRVKDEKSK